MTSTRSPGAPQDKDALNRLAAHWCARMHGPDADDLRSEFESWLRADSENRRAYNQVEEIYLLGASLRPLKSGPNDPSSRSRRRWRLAPTLVAALLIGILALLMINYFQKHKHSETPAGYDRPVQLQNNRFASRDTLRQVKLSDGSLIVLDPHSRLDMRFSAEQRRLTLLSGSARFEVAHEARRFIVSAGGGQVVAKGTIFQVSLTKDHAVIVKLIEGVVDVQMPDDPAQPRTFARRQMKAGEQLSYAVPMSSVMTVPDIGGAKAPLATAGELIDQANRLQPHDDRIILESADIAGKPVSGAFEIHDSATLASRLSAIFHLTVDRSQPGLIILRPAAE